MAVLLFILLPLLYLPRIQAIYAIFRKYKLGILYVGLIGLYFENRYINSNMGS
ncbi:hypothetical protein [Pontibacter arcticus]|uniref:hypothetical protein n=1 Tax=Pontibacter arcticus TaxID=2080288 RepID=UPI001403733A|nr:hypothetical protein [Pontibacter arcticus]